MSEDQVGAEKKFLDAIDYSIFVGVLVISVAIGLYFAFVNKRKPNTTSEYLTGSRQLSVFPILMSLVASRVSGIYFLAQPAEIYMYGSQIMVKNISSLFSITAFIYIFMPVFSSINILSSYEYFKRRFNDKIAMLGSALYLIKTLIFSAAVIYSPAIAFSQLSGLKIEVLIPILSIICTFYTAIGGLRAVVWADAFQTIFIFIGAIGLPIIGTYHVGGFKILWERNDNTGRTEFFNFDPDPRVRSTFWSVVIGGFFGTLSETTTNQMAVQRCLALSTFKKIKITLWMYYLLITILSAAIGYIGLIAFAVFYDCDPITTKKVAKMDQIIPYLWMFLTKEIPALPGLFISALFSASFSTISTTLNSMAGVFVINIVKPLWKRPITEEKATFLMKIMVAIFGCLVLGLAFLIDKMGGLFQLSISFSALVNGPMLGLFILGMLFPRVDGKSAFIASLTGFASVAWIFIGAQTARSRNQIFHPTKNFSIEGCDNNTLDLYYSDLMKRKQNFTINRTEPFPLYAISYYYYTLIAIFTTVMVGLIFSCFTGNSDRRIRENMDLYSPMVKKYIRSKSEEPEGMSLNSIGNTD